MPTGLTGVTGRSLGVQEPNDRHCRRAAVPRPRAPDRACETCPEIVRENLSLIERNYREALITGFFRRI